MYPLTLFVLSRKATDIPAGLHEYLPESHSLRTTQHTISTTEVGAFGIGDQPWLSEASAIIIVTADIELMTEHFAEQTPEGKRGERYAYIETGAAAQNIQLQASGLGLGAVLVGGFYDDKVNSTLNLPPNKQPTALLCVGNV